MKVDEIEVNQEINIIIKLGSYQGAYPSKISDIDENSIKVLTPSSQGGLIPLRENDEVDILFPGDSAAFKYTAVVRDRVLEPVPQTIITLPDELERIQRRDYFRLEVKEKVVYCKIDDDGEVSGEPVETTTSDLSGGGARIIVEEKLEPEVLLELYFEISVIKETPIIGKVVNIYRTTSTVEAGIEFVNIEAKIRDKIMGWLFDKQREWRRKGLL